jgi:hypothetical protein
MVCPPQAGDTTTVTKALRKDGRQQAIDPRLPTPGSAIVRKYKGRSYRVIVHADGQFEFEGPVYNFSETHYLPASQVTNTYKGTLFALTGKVNSGGFRGLAAGECLFLGASGSRRVPDSDPAGGDWEITFRFAGSPNRTNITVGSIPGVAKQGWEYLWVRYADVEDTASHTLVKQPVAAYVEQVYELADFAGLGIGS